MERDEFWRVMVAEQVHTERKIFVDEMGPSLTVEGATTSVVFEAFVEQVLAPSPRRGQVVVMGITS